MKSPAERESLPRMVPTAVDVANGEVTHPLLSRRQRRRAELEQHYGVQPF